MSRLVGLMRLVTWLKLHYDVLRKLQCMLRSIYTSSYS